ncbi:MAG TPA: porphobilinogen synthase [Chitinophagales bacterium]|nr:porphobilinogen synthase [Chitinophagales bacterium]
MLRRNRTLRRTEAIREMVAETIVTASDFIVPLFVTEGKNVKQEIPSMPGYYRLSLDNLKKEVTELWSLGLKSVLLFVKVPDKLKDDKCSEALNKNGLILRAIKEIKNTVPGMCVMTDVALDPFSPHGHDGLVKGHEILNDETVEVLCKMSVLHAKAGADFVAPSDMMDFRIAAIRTAFEENGLTKTGILAYSAKYASCFYGPFRDALDSAPGFGDKKTYQMDYRNRTEAIKEAIDDVNEGADIVMVKPAGAYLDIIREVKNNVPIPVAAYQVSGEYAVIKAAAQKGWINEKAAMLESITAIKRSGADLIASYFAKEFVKGQK